jgi:hypothetical protein
MGDLSSFERGQIVGGRLGGASVTTATLLGVKRVTVSKVTTVELNIDLEDPVSTKSVRRELHKSNIHSRNAITKSLITESNAQMCKRWCHEHKTWTSDNWKLAHDNKPSL